MCLDDTKTVQEIQGEQGKEVGLDRGGVLEGYVGLDYALYLGLV